MTREPGILVVAVNQLPGEANRTGQGKGRALNAWLHPLYPPHEEAWSIASNYSTHPPPEPYAKQSRQCKRGRGGAR